MKSFENCHAARSVRRIAKMGPGGVVWEARRDEAVHRDRRGCCSFLPV